MLPANSVDSAPFTVRVGLPTTGGRLLVAAKQRGYAVLFSANAFALPYPRGHERATFFRRFRRPDPAQLEGVDAALDSSGFIAAAENGEYRWGVEEYVDLVAAHPWRWWASMDYCCEPEVADDRPLRVLRMAATIAQYYACRSAARARGLPDPMPVLQGWTAQEYLESIEWMAPAHWPSLVGVGSVCRRHLRGGDGVLEILSALDGALPPHVKLHLFGLKGNMLAALSHHPRIASVDSMAWDVAARRERPVGRTADFRIQCMERWVRTQQAQLLTQARGAGVQGTFSVLFEGIARTDFETLVLEALALQHADLILSNDLAYPNAVLSTKRDAPTAMAIVRQRGASDACLTALDELIAGLGDRVAHLQSLH